LEVVVSFVSSLLSLQMNTDVKVGGQCKPGQSKGLPFTVKVSIAYCANSSCAGAQNLNHEWRIIANQLLVSYGMGSIMLARLFPHSWKKLRGFQHSIAMTNGRKWRSDLDIQADHSFNLASN